jgi:hypothetical protein
MLALLALAPPPASVLLPASSARRRRVAVLWLTPPLTPVMRTDTSGTRSAMAVPLEKSCCSDEPKVATV